MIRLEMVPMTWERTKKAQSRFSRVDSSAFSSTPSFHDRRQRLNYRFLAVFVAYMFQHGTGSLGATAAESVIELIDAHGVRALVAREDHFARTSGNPVDRVHHD
jgi:hypothetical protein